MCSAVFQAWRGSSGGRRCADSLPCVEIDFGEIRFHASASIPKPVLPLVSVSTASLCNMHEALHPGRLQRLDLVLRIAGHDHRRLTVAGRPPAPAPGTPGRNCTARSDRHPCPRILPTRRSRIPRSRKVQRRNSRAPSASSHRRASAAAPSGMCPWHAAWRAVRSRIASNGSARRPAEADCSPVGATSPESSRRDRDNC